MKWWRKQSIGIKISLISLTIILLLFIINEWPFSNLIERYKNGISIELYGFAFDIALFGLLITYIRDLNNKKEKVSMLWNELKLVRGWKQPEAGYKMRNLIIQLKELGEEIKTKDIQEAYINKQILDFLLSNNLNIFNLWQEKVDIKEFYFDNVRFEKTELVSSQPSIDG